MYSIFADSTCIFNDVTPLESLKISEPKLVMEDSAAGSLEFVLPPGNAGYDIIERLTTMIIVKCTNTQGVDEEIWRGRVLNESTDFMKRKKLYCEGELAFLNDSIQPQAQYLSDSTTISSFLNSLIDIHNEQVGANSGKLFTVGWVDVEDGDALDDSDAIYRYTDYETTLECINTKLIDKLGGHIRVRWSNGVRYIDYLKDDSPHIISSSQVIQFGKNLLDYTTELSNDDFVTAIIPLGASQDEEVIEGLTNYLTVDGATDPDTGQTHDGIFVQLDEAVSNYGWICTTVNWDDVTNRNTLLSKAKKYLTEIQFEKLVLTIQMLDLHYLTGSAEPLHVLDKIRCISAPHGMDRLFPVSKMEINLLDPSNSTYTLGSDEKISLSSATAKANAEIMAEIDRIPSKTSILDAAKANVFSILTGTVGGYVRFIKDSDDQITDIVISDQLQDQDSLHKWIFNQAGLYHMKRDTTDDEWTGSSLNAAITMTGDIVADYITTGNLNCDRLHGGVINGQNINGGNINGAHIRSESGRLYVDIQGGNLKVRNDANNFLMVDDARGGTFAIGGRYFATYNSSVYYGDYETVYIGKAASDAGAGSDKRLKHNIETLDKNLSKSIIRKVRPVSFEYDKEKGYNNEHGIRYGLIAQELRDVLNQNGVGEAEMEYVRHDGYHTIEYKELIAHLINTIQDLYDEIDELKGANNG